MAENWMNKAKLLPLLPGDGIQNKRAPLKIMNGLLFRCTALVFRFAAPVFSPYPLDREMGLLKKYYWMLMKCLALLHFPITEAKQVFACR